VKDHLKLWFKPVAPPTVGPQEPSMSFEPGMSMGRAGAILAMSFLSQYLVSALLYSFIPPANGDYSASQIAFVWLVSILVGGLAMIGLSTHLLGRDLFERSNTAGAWVIGSPKQLLKGLVAGAALAVLVAAPVAIFFPPEEGKELLPLFRVASASGFPTVVYLLISVILAPPLEELLFRGVVFGSISRSFGPVVSGISTTIIFVAAHYSVILWHQPVIISLTAVGFAVMLVRIWSRAVGPAVALHMSYNGMLLIQSYVFYQPS